MLNSIDYSIKNVVSIEDPIEHVMPSISQMEVNESAGITFSQLLRNSLRQNPDIICLGEIRDEDTAQVAIHAAQTGHLIIATLHSNDNIGTIDRLANLHVPLRSIAGTLRMVISQRLVRKLCSCKKSRKVTAEEALKFRQFGIECDQVYEPKGCSKCGNTGYAGRMALFDILMVDEELRSLLEDEHTNLSNIQRKLQARTRGNVMERAGLLQAADGVTSVAEVLRVTLELKN
jgi:type IV pilus assembly protein PilB